MTTMSTPATTAHDSRFAELCILCGRGVAVSKMPDGRYAHLGTLVCEANKARLAAEGQGVDMSRLMWDSFMAEQCPFCGSHKRKMTSFCWMCFKSLPRGIGSDLKRRRLGDGLRLVAFIEAMGFLKRKQKEAAVSS